MLFHVYGGNALYQWGAMILVLVGLILLNEVARRTKLGGLIIFGAVPVVLTIYFIVIAACAAAGQTWAVENRLVPLYEALCITCRLYWFYDDKVWLGNR